MAKGSKKKRAQGPEKKPEQSAGKPDGDSTKMSNKDYERETVQTAN